LETYKDIPIHFSVSHLTWNHALASISFVSWIIHPTMCSVVLCWLWWK